MCLLDAVEQWDDQQIVCSTASHRATDNPLWRHNQLEVLSGLEYAVQAMAVHVGLVTPPDPARRAAIGYVGAVRDVTIHTQRLDDVATDLTVHVTLVLTDEARFIYSFRLSTGTQTLMDGRASIFLKDARP